jgi:small ligand-binding sensory domain FIST
MPAATREAALDAIARAAEELAVDPAELTVSAYRTYRAERADVGEALPSELTISLLFGGWPRAVVYAQRPSLRRSEALSGQT